MKGHKGQRRHKGRSLQWHQGQRPLHELQGQRCSSWQTRRWPKLSVTVSSQPTTIRNIAVQPTAISQQPPTTVHNNSPQPAATSQQRAATFHIFTHPPTHPPTSGHQPSLSALRRATCTCPVPCGVRACNMHVLASACVYMSQSRDFVASSCRTQSCKHAPNCSICREKARPPRRHEATGRSLARQLSSDLRRRPSTLIIALRINAPNTAHPNKNEIQPIRS